jgi:hypothetical protein
MNRRFWKWLAHVDARIAALILVSTCAILSAAAILHIGFAGWGDSGTIEGWVSVNEVEAVDPEPAANSFSEKRDPLSDPFTSKYLVKYLSALNEFQDSGSQSAVVAPEPQKQDPEPKQVVVTPARMALLIFHGVMKRPDSTEMALIEDAVVGTIKFYSAGEVLDAFTIKTFDARQLLLSGGGGGTWKLPVNHPTEIEVQDP